MIKILLVDDQRVVREKLRSVLQGQRDLQIIGMAEDGYSAIEQIETLHPDVILLDIEMPKLGGLQTAQIISEKYRHTKVIILSSYDDSKHITKSLAAGANGYIVKQQIDPEIAETIRSVHKGYTQLGPGLFEKIVPSSQGESQILVAPRPKQTEVNSGEPIEGEFVEGGTSMLANAAQTTLTKINDWSHSARELIDTMPLPWTRGVLYMLVGFIGIFLPWAFFYTVDEIGTAQGRLEYQGDTVKREADIDGSVSVLKVHVKKGERVQAGQTIMELDSKSVREQIQQNQIRLDGAEQRLNQLLLMKNQVGLGTNTQVQQNQSQLLEKQSQIAQAEQNLDTLQSNANLQASEKLAQVRQAEQALADRQSSYTLQKQEKLTQVRQAEQGVVDAETAYNLAVNRLKDAQTEVNRYYKLFRSGAIPEIRVKEIESVAKERNQLVSQAQANLTQAKLRLKEQQDNYQKLIQQTKSDITQAQLRLKEQEDNYQRLLNQTKADIEQAKLRLTEQKRGSNTLVQTGKLAVMNNDRQIKEIQGQIAALQSEIDQAKAQQTFLAKQLQRYTIKADIDGTIFDLPITREGSVVQPKQLIAEIAPHNKNELVFKGQIPTSQSESLRQGEQKDVKLKFEEFPFESYGVVPGKLIWISPNSRLVPTPQGNITSYDIEVKLDESCMNYEGKCIPFKAGQPAIAEVVIRKRKIIDSVLDPFKKLNNNN
jgi:HlyD family secretion protein